MASSIAAPGGRGEDEVKKEVYLYCTTRTHLQASSLCQLNRDLIHIPVLCGCARSDEDQGRGEKEELI